MFLIEIAIYLLISISFFNKGTQPIKTNDVAAQHYANYKVHFYGNMANHYLVL